MYLGQTLVWTYEKLSKALRLEIGTYKTVSDFNKFLRELNKSISANTDMQITFIYFQEKGKNGHLYHKYRINISHKLIEVDTSSMPNPVCEEKEVVDYMPQKILPTQKPCRIMRKWEKCFHEMTETEYLRLVDKE